MTTELLLLLTVGTFIFLSLCPLRSPIPLRSSLRHVVVRSKRYLPRGEGSWRGGRVGFSIGGTARRGSIILKRFLFEAKGELVKDFRTNGKGSTLYSAVLFVRAKRKKSGDGKLCHLADHRFLSRFLCRCLSCCYSRPYFYSSSFISSSLHPLVSLLLSHPTPCFICSSLSLSLSLFNFTVSIVQDNDSRTRGKQSNKN